MSIRFVGSIFFILISFYLQGQNLSDWKDRSKWQLRPSFGLNFPLTKLFNDTPSDNLINYSDGMTFYLQGAGVSWFFREHWGIEINVQASYSSETNARKRSERFSGMLQNEYQDKYFVTTSSNASFGEEDIVGGSVQRGLIGINYRRDIGRFFIYPKLAIGVTSFNTDRRNAFLKEKNSNTLLKVEYSARIRPNDHFTTAGSLIAGYKLSKRVFFNFEIMTSYYRADFTFTKTTTDLNSGQSSLEMIYYGKDMFTLSLGTGLIIVLR
jgi:hypothetical protein